MKYINKGEINFKIAKIDFEDKPMRIMNNNRVAITIREGDKPRKVDYCNDWSDAGWLAQREGISITYYSKFDMWGASADGRESVHESPTVAIALCYLKMKGVSYEY
jgi:hypothetical protein